jgi:hypothetical protein
LGDFRQFGQSGLCHHFRNRPAESGVAVGGNLLAGFNGLGNGGLVFRVRPEWRIDKA